MTTKERKKLTPFGWRKMTWVLVIWTGLCVAWFVSAASASSSCTGQYKTDCQAGEAIGRGVAGTAVFAVWALGFLVLTGIWFMTRPRQ